ncbi:MAG TPA: hypothetical protein VH142_20730 [Polyangiaceae bacterium]|jgi:hypothetical protein|nr:hypothetical protein [Polyangiaceae bacterium]
MSRLAFTSVFATLAAVMSAACADVPADARIGITAPNGSEAAFGPVAAYLGERCGTLDCHGQRARNLQIYSCEGLRLSEVDVPICSRNQGGKPTTPEEHQATYRSLVGLEPTVMSAVVVDHGEHPEWLTFVRKARGLESHKGGVLITPGDDQDVCITSWLAGQTNLTACAAAFGYPKFPTPPTTQ